MYEFYLKSLLLLKANRILSIILVVTLALVCALILSQRTFDNDIATMLPKNSEARKTLRFINKSNIANKIVISLRLKDSSHSLNDLQRQIERLVVRLRSPLIDKIDYKLSDNSPLDDLEALTPCLPQMLGQEAVDKLENALDARKMQKIVNSLYQRLVSPAGMGQSAFISNDPFGLKGSIFKDLQTFKNIWGFKMAPGRNYFISRDLRHGMLIIRTPVQSTNTSQSRKLIAAINKELDALPDWLSADIIAGHLRSLSNEKVIKKDIRFTLTLSFIGFLLLFAFFYKYDFRCLFIMGIPILATLFVLAGMTFVFDRTLLFVIGLGGVVVGIAVDYGIHMYSAMAAGRSFRGAVRVLRPLVAGGLTTFGVFAVFMFSDTPGYRQLGVFAGCSIILSLLLSILLLPILFTNTRMPRFSTQWLYRLTEKMKKYPQFIFACWFILMLLSAFAFSRIHFADDLKQLDGSMAEIDAAEQRFQDVWENAERPAILAVSGKTEEEAADRAERTCYLLRAKTEGKFFCVTDIWPSLSVRRENLARFARFTASGKLERLEKQLNLQAEKKGFADNTFKSFFSVFRQGIEYPGQQKLPEMFQTLIKQTTNSEPGNYSFFIFFPDQAELVKLVRDFTSSKGSNFVISRNAFRQMLSEAVSGRIFTLLYIAALAVGGITFILMRSPGAAVLALLPVLSAIIVTGAFFVLFAIPVNAAACIGGIVVIGLAIDYGIFMANEDNHTPSSSVLPAITLSSLTTLVGAGAVIFAVHPMLRSVGIVLCVGIFTAWTTSIAVIPAIREIFKKSNSGKAKIVSQLLAVFIMFTGSGCSTVNPFKREPLPPLPAEPAEKMLAEFSARRSQSFSALSGVIFNWHSRKISTLCVVDIDHKNRKIAVLGMNLMGVKLFEAAGDTEKAKLLFSALDLKLERPDAFAEAMIKDIGRIYFDQLPAKPYSMDRSEKELICSSSPGKSQLFKYYFGGSPLVLLKKQAFNDNILCWEISYYKYKKVGQFLIPHAVFCRNLKYNYYLEVRLKEFAPRK